MRNRVRAAERLGTTQLPDGRRLGWAEWGPASGAPVLLCPGAATSRSLGFGGEVVEGLAVRLISVDRPGLGASDPAPGRTFADWVEDVRAFAAERELGEFAIVGNSQGAPFALACAAAGIVRAAAVVSGTDELARVPERLAPEVRRLIEAIAADPAGVERSFGAFASGEKMWELLMATCGDFDRAIYMEDEFARALRETLSEAFRQGPAGYARDTVLAMSRWTFDVGAIAVPVDLWYGANDTSTVHSPDLGESLARRIAAARRHVLADAGGSLLWTHAEQVLRTLLMR
jgi:pimeloyl-ACP methyl ester carboxylesterase